MAWARLCIVTLTSVTLAEYVGPSPVGPSQPGSGLPYELVSLSPFLARGGLRGSLSAAGPPLSIVTIRALTLKKSQSRPEFLSMRCSSVTFHLAPNLPLFRAAMKQGYSMFKMRIFVLGLSLVFLSACGRVDINGGGENPPEERSSLADTKASPDPDSNSESSDPLVDEPVEPGSGETDLVEPGSESDSELEESTQLEDVTAEEPESNEVPSSSEQEPAPAPTPEPPPLPARNPTPAPTPEPPPLPTRKPQIPPPPVRKPTPEPTPVPTPTPKPLSREERCINELSEGKNSFKAKVNKSALKFLLRGMKKYRDEVENKRLALLIDYSQNSRVKRSYLIDLKACDILAWEYVAHGGAIYTPRTIIWSEPKRNGYLERCVKDDGTRQYMTRPGFYVTAGCHITQKRNWPVVYDGCHGIKLMGLEERNREAFQAGIVLHEHTYVPNTNVIKPIGQGCPIYPPGRLKSMTRFGIQEGMLVYLYVPQCSTANSRWM